MPINEPTHGDILEKLGELKGQVATLITLVAEKREDITNLYGRVSTLEKTATSREELGEVEKRISGLEKEFAKELGKWAGVTMVCALVVSMVAPRIQQGLGIVEHKTDHKIERVR